MSNYKISRRTFVTSAGAVFTLPLLEALFPFSKLAQAAAADPTRYVLFYMPNGTYNRADKPIWATRPGAIGSGNTSLALSPFAANYGDMTNINNLANDVWSSNKLSAAIGGDEHRQQMAAYLTCSDAVSSMTSFENVLATAQGKPAFVLSGGVTTVDNYYDGFISYQNGKPNSGISNPGDLYTSLLAKISPTAVPSPLPSMTPSTAVKNNSKSILDSAIADFGALKANLGTADKTKLDEYLSSIRHLETTVGSTIPSPTPTSGDPAGAACVKPTLNSALNNSKSDSSQYMAKLQAFNDLIKIAFACDITRSVSIMMDTETSFRSYAAAPSNLVYMNQNIDGGYNNHIAIAHESGLSTQGYNLAVTRDRYLFSVAIDLANKLKGSKDPSGSSMLDNTIIQAGFGVEDGNHSSFTDQRPLVLLGGRNMITTGMSYTLGNNQFRDLYFTIARKMGVGIANFQGSTTILSI
jgi:hypothetical protein